jgi:hypothetical protein
VGREGLSLIIAKTGLGRLTATSLPDSSAIAFRSDGTSFSFTVLGGEVWQAGVRSPDLDLTGLVLVEFTTSPHLLLSRKLVLGLRKELDNYVDRHRNDGCRTSFKRLAAHQLLVETEFHPGYER